MKCLLLKLEKVVGFEDWPGIPEQDAIARSHGLLSASSKEDCDGFELWDSTRLVLRHPPAAKPPDKDG